MNDCDTYMLELEVLLNAPFYFYKAQNYSASVDYIYTYNPLSPFRVVYMYLA